MAVPVQLTTNVKDENRAGVTYHIEGELVRSSADLSRVLLEKASVALVPGGAFGADAHMRLSYALDQKDLEAGIAKIARSLDTHCVPARSNSTSLREASTSGSRGT